MDLAKSSSGNTKPLPEPGLNYCLQPFFPGVDELKYHQVSNIRHTLVGN